MNYSVTVVTFILLFINIIDIYTPLNLVSGSPMPPRVRKRPDPSILLNKHVTNDNSHGNHNANPWINQRNSEPKAQESTSNSNDINNLLDKPFTPHLLTDEETLEFNRQASENQETLSEVGKAIHDTAENEADPHDDLILAAAFVEHFLETLRFIKRATSLLEGLVESLKKYIGKNNKRKHVYLNYLNNYEDNDIEEMLAEQTNRFGTLMSYEDRTIALSRDLMKATKAFLSKTGTDRITSVNTFFQIRSSALRALKAEEDMNLHFLKLFEDFETCDNNSKNKKNCNQDDSSKDGIKNHLSSAQSLAYDASIKSVRASKIVKSAIDTTFKSLVPSENMDEWRERLSNAYKYAATAENLIQDKFNVE